MCFMGDSIPFENIILEVKVLLLVRLCFLGPLYSMQGRCILVISFFSVAGGSAVVLFIYIFFCQVVSEYIAMQNVTNTLYPPSFLTK